MLIKDSNVAHRSNQSGMTLVELMIAMVLGLLLIAGVTQVFIGTKQGYRLQEAQSRVQENGRAAMSFLMNDIRMADFWGCTQSVADITNNINTADDEYDAAIHGFGVGNGLNGVDNDSNAGNTIIDGTDSITLSGAFGSGINVVSTMPNTTSALEITNNSGIQENEILMVSDCLAGDIFQVTQDPSSGGGAEDDLVHGTGDPGSGNGPGNSTGSLSKSYGEDAQVFRMVTRVYSIQTGASGQPALFLNENGNDVELVEGVENMQILYGEDTDADGVANYYVTQGAVVDMDTVVSVRVSLLLRSIENNVTTQAQTYSYNGANTTAADRRLRRVFSSTVMVRNRI